MNDGVRKLSFSWLALDLPWATGISGGSHTCASRMVEVGPYGYEGREEKGETERTERIRMPKEPQTIVRTRTNRVKGLG